MSESADDIDVIAFHPSQPIIVAAGGGGGLAAWIKEGRVWERLWYRSAPDHVGKKLLFSKDGTSIAVVCDDVVTVSHEVQSGRTLGETYGVCTPSHHFPGSNGLSIAEVTQETTIVRSTSSGGIIGRLQPFPELVAES